MCLGKTRRGFAFRNQSGTQYHLIKPQMSQIYADKNPERLRPAAGRGERLAPLHLRSSVFSVYHPFFPEKISAVRRMNSRNVGSERIARSAVARFFITGKTI